jgi:Tfp pilus assembly protein PilX
MKTLPRRATCPPLRQQGVTLIMALIMLVLLTLLALTSYNLGNSNLQIVSNMQQRNEAIAAAHEVIEEAISSTRFSITPGDALASPCANTANSRCVDINGDNVTDVTVTLSPAPACIKAQIVKNSALNPSLDEDAGCSVGEVQNHGTAGAVSGNSLCSNTVYEIHAIATDTVTDASVSVTQGVAMRVADDDSSTNCP